MKPPTTNRGVTETSKEEKTLVSCGLDWLQYSVKWPRGMTSIPDTMEAINAIVSHAVPPHEKLTISGEILRPLRGYSSGMGMSFGRVFWHETSSRQAIGVIFTGEDMRTAVNVLMPHSQMLSWAMARATKISRIDIAVDVRGEPAEPRDLLLAWKRGSVGTSARHVEERTSWENTVAEGLVASPTVYIGRGDSERMLRVYDKARQTGEPGPWTRIELQARDNQAMVIARAMQLRGIVDGGRAAIRSFCSADGIGWYKRALTGPAVDIEPVPRTETNTEKWLRDVAIPSLAKVITQQVQIGDWTIYFEAEKAIREALEEAGKNPHIMARI